MNRVRVVGFLGCAAWPTMNAPSHSQDRAAVVPEMQVLLQNEHVRVQFHDVFYSGPVTHRIANTGTTAIHNLIVESTHVAV